MELWAAEQAGQKDRLRTRLRRRAPRWMRLEGCLVNIEGEGAPWMPTRLAPLAANVLSGLSSTPGPPLTTETLSDDGTVGVKRKAGEDFYAPPQTSGKSVKAGAAVGLVVSETTSKGGGL